MHTTHRSHNVICTRVCHTSRTVEQQVGRVEAGNARVDEFVHVTVPRIVDEQSGAVTRKLQKARETFDIENAKIAKRERKVYNRSKANETSKT